MDPTKGGGQTKFTYFTDELGHIVETKDASHFDNVGGETLGPLSIPKAPRWVDTPEKQARWKEYWSRIKEDWNEERRQEFRNRTFHGAAPKGLDETGMGAGH